jgi:hypothetical protein
MTETEALIPLERIEQKILRIRGANVMLDEDLAELYGVEVRTLNQAVKRNADRFPDDFMFQLSADEEARVNARLRSQIVILEPAGRGKYRKYPPYAFTEQGVAMLSSVLRSPRAVQVNIQIMRTFVNLRRMLASNEDLTRKLAALESNTTHSSKPCSTLSANSWPRQRRRSAK